MNDNVLTSLVYAQREAAKAGAAALREYEDTIAALTEACDGVLADPLPLSHAAIKALVRSAFLAGCNFEFDRHAAAKRPEGGA